MDMDSKQRKVGRPKSDGKERTESSLSVGLVGMKRKELRIKLDKRKVISENMAKFEEDVKKAEELIRTAAEKKKEWTDSLVQIETDLKTMVEAMKPDWGREHEIWYVVNIVSPKKETPFYWVFFDPIMFNTFLGIMSDKGYAAVMKIDVFYCINTKDIVASRINYVENIEEPNDVDAACDCFDAFFNIDDSTTPLMNLYGALYDSLTKEPNNVEKIKEILDAFRVRN